MTQPMRKPTLMRLVAFGLLVLALSGEAITQERTTKSVDRGPSHAMPDFASDTAFDVVLGRPTDHAITLSLLSYEQNTNVTIKYGTESVDMVNRTQVIPLKKGQPTEYIMDGLSSGKQYHYRVMNCSGQAALAAGSFHTLRRPGASFRFTLTADSHLDSNTDLGLYQLTLANALADRPDFHVDLGDTFMTEKHDSRAPAAQQYLAQRYFFGQFAHSAPLFLTLGNHDGEEVRHWRDGPDSLGVWANGMRTRYFPNPQPNGFYTGNSQVDSQAGALQDYYSWQWGDALFVVLNPYWHGSQRRSDERWGLSLGDAQYQWLRTTLERSSARFKFIFVHQLIGGIDRQGRGGVEGAPFGE